jgi:hypothetical protein
VPPAERKKVGLGSAMTFHAGLTRHDPDSTAAVAAFTARIAEENALARAAFERAVHPVLEQLGEKNEWVPDGDETLEQLPPEVRERIKDSFLNSYKANGYASREEAEAAWSSAQLSDSFVQFMFNYSVENPDGSTGLRSVELTRTGR